MAQLVKNLPAMQETRVQSLGWEDPLEKEMATQSKEFQGERNWAGGSPWDCRVEHDCVTFTFH